jgi:hypothetical protein
VGTLLTGRGWRLPLCLLLAIASGEALARLPEPPGAAVAAHALSLQPPGFQATARRSELMPPNTSVDPWRPQSSRVAEPPFSPAEEKAREDHRLADRKGDKDHHKSRGKD